MTETALPVLSGEKRPGEAPAFWTTLKKAVFDWLELGREQPTSEFIWYTGEEFRKQHSNQCSALLAAADSIQTALSTNNNRSNRGAK